MADQGTNSYIQVKDGDWENLNRALRYLYNQVDALTGLRGLGASPSQRYTPGHTNRVNLDSTTTMEANFLRVANTVVIFGEYRAKPTAGALSTHFDFSLPVPPKFSADSQGAGVSFSPGVAGQGASILGSAALQVARVQWISGNLTDQPYSFVFVYSVN